MNSRFHLFEKTVFTKLHFEMQDKLSVMRANNRDFWYQYLLSFDCDMFTARSTAKKEPSADVEN